MCSFILDFSLGQNNRGTHDKLEFSASSWGLYHWREEVPSLDYQPLFGKMSPHSSPRRQVRVEVRENSGNRDLKVPASSLTILRAYDNL